MMRNANFKTTFAAPKYHSTSRQAADNAKRWESGHFDMAFDNSVRTVMAEALQICM